jgi:putative membrane protein
MTSTRKILMRSAFLPLGVAALALTACVGDPKFSASTDHDGNSSYRATENQSAMVTTDEQMETDLLAPREDPETDADAYPELGIDPAYEPVREAAVVPMPTNTAVAMVPATTYPATTYPSTQTQLPTSLSATSDTRFTQTAMSGSATEIALARVAVTKAQSPEVRSFAQQMLNDHRQIATNIDNFALQRGYVVNWSITPEQQATIDRLNALNGAAFDEAYMEEMVTAHTNTVAMLQAQSSSGTETATLARETLPTVEHHLMMARDIESRV